MVTTRGMQLLIVLSIATMIAACTATTSIRTSNEPHSPTDPANVKIFLSEKPSQQYKEIGKVTVDKYGMIGMTPASGEKINQLLREEAAKIGGDAIINVSEDFASVSGVVVVFTQVQ
jgi:hypothetical protein